MTEAAGGGTDTVKSAVTLHAGANLENLTLTGAAAINGTGNALANIAHRQRRRQRPIGLGGDDTLNGGAGNDTMAGGARQRHSTSSTMPATS